jgi:hypothetical protein
MTIAAMAPRDGPQWPIFVKTTKSKSGLSEDSPETKVRIT